MRACFRCAFLSFFSCVCALFPCFFIQYVVYLKIKIGRCSCSSFSFAWGVLVSALFAVPSAGVRVLSAAASAAGGAVPSLGAVSRSACCFAASFFSCRPSARALGGFSVAAGFRSVVLARRFAALWAAVLPSRCRGCLVRWVPSPGAGLFVVSVPVLASSVPAAVAAGVALSVFGAPPVVRRVVSSSPVWSLAPAPAPVPSSRRAVFAASLALGFSPASALPPAPAPAPAGLPLVGFSGSRSLPSSFAPLVGALVASVGASGRGVAVGCAAGADLLVRSACPSAVVFRAASRLRAALAARSASFVRAVASSGPGRCLVVLPCRLCPVGLLPSSVASRCFCGLGSGSWASAALAAGLGVPVVVFGLPLAALPASWGRWVPAAASGPWASGFRLVPAAPRLF